MTRERRHHQAREATRRAILDAALALFVADGYAQVSLRNIAAKVEYSPGAIYSYFSSKDDIFFALAEEGFRLLGAAHLARPDTADAVELDTTTGDMWAMTQGDAPQFELIPREKANNGIETDAARGARLYDELTKKRYYNPKTGELQDTRPR